MWMLDNVKEKSQSPASLAYQREMVFLPNSLELLKLSFENPPEQVWLGRCIARDCLCSDSDTPLSL
jgi:hypothetical protein